MGTIAQELTRIQTAKAGIKSAIEAKGVTVGSSLTLDDYPQKIAEIPTGSSVQEAPENDVNFYDYDGFRVASFTIAEAKALTQAEYNAILPPTHEGLTFQEWNWSLNDITTYNRRFIDIGANYKTTDGKTHIKINVDKNGELFALKAYIVGYTITINWGDGSTEASNGSVMTHTYSTAGRYEIVIENNIGTGNAAWEYGDVGNTYYHTREMIEEILFDEKVKLVSYSLRYASGKVSIPKTALPVIDTSTFQYANISSLAIPRDCTGIKSSNVFSTTNGIVCFPKTFASTSFSSIFFGSEFKKIVYPEDFSNGFNNVFVQANTQLEVISIPSSFGIAASASSYIFNYSSKLRYIDIVQGWIPSPGTSLTLSASIYWSPEAIVDFFNKLGTTQTAVTLTFGSTNLNKLTADQKAIATNKGYTLA